MISPNTYEEGETVQVPGHLVGKPVQCYDRTGRVFAGVVVAASYEEEDLFADVAVINDQARSGTASLLAVWTIQRHLRLGSSSDPQPNTFAVHF